MGSSEQDYEALEEEKWVGRRGNYRQEATHISFPLCPTLSASSSPNDIPKDHSL